MKSLSKLKYEERLRILKLTSLETRRLRGDLIQQYKIINGLDIVHWKAETLAPICTLDKQGPPAARLRSVFKLETENIFRLDSLLKVEPTTATTSQLQEREIVKCEPRHQFFVNRIVNIWNNLPNDVKSAKSVLLFKKGLDKHTSNIEATIYQQSNKSKTNNIAITTRRVAIAALNGE